MPTMYARALFSYESKQSDELNFEKNDLITLIDYKGENDWWKGTSRGKTGFFPANHVALQKDDEQITLSLKRAATIIQSVERGRSLRIRKRELEAGVPNGWCRKYNRSNEYWCFLSLKTGHRADALRTPSMPQGWQMKISKKGKLYYFNRLLKETRWNEPKLKETTTLQKAATAQNTTVKVEKQNVRLKGWTEQDAAHKKLRTVLGKDVRIIVKLSQGLFVEKATRIKLQILIGEKGLSWEEKKKKNYAKSSETDVMTLTSTNYTTVEWNTSLLVSFPGKLQFPEMSIQIIESRYPFTLFAEGHFPIISGHRTSGGFSLYRMTRIGAENKARATDILDKNVITTLAWDRPLQLRSEALWFRFDREPLKKLQSIRIIMPPGSVGIQLQPAHSDWGARVFAFLLIDGKPGPIESKSVELGMFLHSINGIDVSTMKLSTILRDIRKLFNGKKSMQFCTHPSENARKKIALECLQKDSVQVLERSFQRCLIKMRNNQLKKDNLQLELINKFEKSVTLLINENVKGVSFKPYLLNEKDTTLSKGAMVESILDETQFLPKNGISIGMYIARMDGVDATKIPFHEIIRFLRKRRKENGILVTFYDKEQVSTLDENSKEFAVIKMQRWLRQRSRILKAMKFVQRKGYVHVLVRPGKFCASVSSGPNNFGAIVSQFDNPFTSLSRAGVCKGMLIVSIGGIDVTGMKFRETLQVFRKQMELGPGVIVFRKVRKNELESLCTNAFMNRRENAASLLQEFFKKGKKIIREKAKNKVIMSMEKEKSTMEKEKSTMEKEKSTMEEKKSTMEKDTSRIIEKSTFTTMEKDNASSTKVEKSKSSTIQEYDIDELTSSSGDDDLLNNPKEIKHVAPISNAVQNVFTESKEKSHLPIRAVVLSRSHKNNDMVNEKYFNIPNTAGLTVRGITLSRGKGDGTCINVPHVIQAHVRGMLARKEMTKPNLEKSPENLKSQNSESVFKMLQSSPPKTVKLPNSTSPSSITPFKQSRNVYEADSFVKLHILQLVGLQRPKIGGKTKRHLLKRGGRFVAAIVGKEGDSWDEKVKAALHSTHGIARTCETKKLWKSKNPVYNESFLLQLDGLQREHCEISIRVFDEKDRCGDDIDLIGECTIPLPIDQRSSFGPIRRSLFSQLYTRAQVEFRKDAKDAVVSVMWNRTVSGQLTEILSQLPERKEKEVTLAPGPLGAKLKPGFLGRGCRVSAFFTADDGTAMQLEKSGIQLGMYCVQLNESKKIGHCSYLEARNILSKSTGEKRKFIFSTRPSDTVLLYGSIQRFVKQADPDGKALQILQRTMRRKIVKIRRKRKEKENLEMMILREKNSNAHVRVHIIQMLNIPHQKRVLPGKTNRFKHKKIHRSIAVIIGESGTTWDKKVFDAAQSGYESERTWHGYIKDSWKSNPICDLVFSLQLNKIARPEISFRILDKVDEMQLIGESSLSFPENQRSSKGIARHPISLHNDDTGIISLIWNRSIGGKLPECKPSQTQKRRGKRKLAISVPSGEMGVQLSAGFHGYGCRVSGFLSNDDGEGYLIEKKGVQIGDYIVGLLKEGVHSKKQHVGSMPYLKALRIIQESSHINRTIFFNSNPSDEVLTIVSLSAFLISSDPEHKAVIIVQRAIRQFLKEKSVARRKHEILETSKLNFNALASPHEGMKRFQNYQNNVLKPSIDSAISNGKGKNKRKNSSIDSVISNVKGKSKRKKKIDRMSKLINIQQLSPRAIWRRVMSELHKQSLLNRSTEIDEDFKGFFGRENFQCADEASIENGDLVIFAGLKRHQQLNGRYGRIIDFDYKSERYKVKTLSRRDEYILNRAAIRLQATFRGHHLRKRRTSVSFWDLCENTEEKDKKEGKEEDEKSDPNLHLSSTVQDAIISTRLDVQCSKSEIGNGKKMKHLEVSKPMETVKTSSIEEINKRTDEFLKAKQNADAKADQEAKDFATELLQSKAFLTSDSAQRIKMDSMKRMSEERERHRKRQLKFERAIQKDIKKIENEKSKDDNRILLHKEHVERDKKLDTERKEMERLQRKKVRSRSLAKVEREKNQNLNRAKVREEKRHLERVKKLRLEQQEREDIAKEVEALLLGEKLTDIKDETHGNNQTASFLDKTSFEERLSFQIQRQNNERNKKKKKSPRRSKQRTKHRTEMSTNKTSGSNEKSPFSQPLEQMLDTYSSAFSTSKSKSKSFKKKKKKKSSKHSKKNGMFGAWEAERFDTKKTLEDEDWYKDIINQVQFDADRIRSLRPGTTELEAKMQAIKSAVAADEDKQLALAMMRERKQREMLDSRGLPTKELDLNKDDKKWFQEMESLVSDAHENMKELSGANSMFWNEIDPVTPQTQTLATLQNLERLLVHTTQVASALQQVNADTKARLMNALQQQQVELEKEQAHLLEQKRAIQGIVASNSSIDHMQTSNFQIEEKREMDVPSSVRLLTPLPEKLVKIDDKLSGLSAKLEVLHTSLANTQNKLGVQQKSMENFAKGKRQSLEKIGITMKLDNFGPRTRARVSRKKRKSDVNQRFKSSPLNRKIRPKKRNRGKQNFLPTI
eukprot:g6546.t1